MLEKVAQKIATSTSQVIGYDVIITNEKGIVTGASDTRRLDTFHEASIYVIKNRRPLDTRPGYIDNLEGTKPGFTLPIELLGDIVGTIAITGERSKVEKFGLLVKKHAEIMLREEIYIESNLLSEQAHQQFLKEVLAFDPSKSSERLIKTRGLQLGYELSPPFICIAIDLINFKGLIEKLYMRQYSDESPELVIQRIKTDILKEIKLIFNLQTDISTNMSEDKFIVLHRVDVLRNDIYTDLTIKSNKLLERLASNNIKAMIGIGSIADEISDVKRSISEAWKVIEVGKKIKSNKNVFVVNEFLLELLLLNLSKDTIEMIKREIAAVAQTEDFGEISETIKAWCESGFNKIKTASSLFVHRNTLQYRLKKFEDLTQIDIKDYRKVLQYYLGILLIELELM